VSTLATLLFGPLAGPECRRAIGRGWLIVARCLAGGLLATVALSIFWWWWFGERVDPSFSPFESLRGGAVAVLALANVLMLVMGPAVLAGSLAGERERGSLGLLLTTRVGAREIVAGRAAGKLVQLGSLLLAGLPALVLLAACAGFGAATVATALAVPAAVGLGAAGMATGASAVSKRGREALLGIYLLILIFMLAPLVPTSLPTVGWLGPVGLLNPFVCLADLAWQERVGPALITAAIWSALGLAGLALASWRLRPSCLGHMDGGGAADRRRLRRGRRWRVPAVDEARPMLWKELHVERGGRLGGLGFWLGLLLVAFLLLSTLIAGGNVVYYRWIEPNPPQDSAWTATLDGLVGGGTSFLVMGLIQAAVGLRAAVAIASERERNTWDGLLTSPLEGPEIVVGKLWGSLHALRWLLAVALFAWTVAAALGAMPPGYYAFLLTCGVVGSAMMAALGLRCSLSAGTATKAMALTMSLGLALWAAAAFVAVVVVAVGMMALLFAFLAAQTLSLTAATGPWFPPFGPCFTVLLLTGFGLATALLVSESRLRFDRISGRMTGGDVARKVDEFLHGQPMGPVELDAAPPVRPATKPSRAGAIADLGDAFGR